ncbi:MAG: GcrA family cell cycle regulator [Alphaproteobacteria bacterium]
MEWSEERVQKLRDLWSDGFSASQIALRLGGISRNAVIGKAHRLGLKGRPSPIRRPPPVVMTLQENGCRWPIGIPGQPGFMFCGTEAAEGRPYCAAHCQMAYQKRQNSAA